VKLVMLPISVEVRSFVCKCFDCEIDRIESVVALVSDLLNISRHLLDMLSQGIGYQTVVAEGIVLFGTMSIDG
jgi:hypothetical protein